MWPNQQFLADLVTFTEEILNGKFNFFFAVFVLNLKNLKLRPVNAFRWITDIILSKCLEKSAVINTWAKFILKS